MNIEDLYYSPHAPTELTPPSITRLRELSEVLLTLKQHGTHDDDKAVQLLNVALQDEANFVARKYAAALKKDVQQDRGVRRADRATKESK